MKSTLVFGATGAVGGFLLQRLAPRYRVLAVSRKHKSESKDWICADLNDTAVIWPDADIVISLGPLDSFSRWLQRNPIRTLQRVVALSSMSAESKRDSADSHERQVSERLRQSEANILDICSARNMSCTLFRPTLIYGTGTDRSLAPIARFAQRWHILPIPLGAKGLRQPVHAADLAGACDAVLDRPTTFGKVYRLGGGERLRFDTMLLRLRLTSPGFVIPIPLPLPLLRLVASNLSSGLFTASMAARLRKPLIADNTEAIRDFGFHPKEFCAEEVLPARTRRQSTDL